MMKLNFLTSLALFSLITLQGCTAAVIAADVAITGVSAVIGATTTVIGGVVDMVTPDVDEKKK